MMAAAGLLFDAVLLLALLGLALWTVAARRGFDAVLGFVACGLMLALAWVRLGSVDVALTEAAIGAGIGGVLLLRAGVALGTAPGPHPGLSPQAAERGARGDEPAAIPERPGPALRPLIAAGCAVLSVGLAAALLGLPDPAPSLGPALAAVLPATGLGNPVNGVLMGVRAIDTLLEAAVVVLAVIGVWSLSSDRGWGGPAGAAPPPRAGHGPLALLVRVLPPIAVVVGVHVVWVGADAPGGKFQGGAILAAAWILAWMAGRARPPAITGGALRLALVLGPAVFLGVGLAGLALAEGFLAFTPALAKPIVLAIEAPLTLSIAVGLALLVLGPSR